jgi:Skp family chaperone for outer membrane proteins
MKIDRLIAVVFVAIIAVSPAFAQTRPAAQQPAAPSGAAVPDTKIALIYSEAFLDPKTGIAKFNVLLNNLNREFQPRQTDINGLTTRAQTLNDDIEKTRAVADPKTLQQKVDQLEQLKKELTRKGEDAQAAYNKRRGEIFQPLQDDIGKALETYAKAHNINVIIDGSQVPVVYAADSLDITRAFINDFNSKFPATASVTTP